VRDKIVIERRALLGMLLQVLEVTETKFGGEEEEVALEQSGRTTWGMLQWHYHIGWVD
jgi:hypothetical protein